LPTLSEIKTILAGQKQMLNEKYGVVEIGVFGSYARGGQKSQSDVDILVTFEENANITLLDFIRLENYLTDILGVKVNLVEKSALKPQISAHVLQEVVIL
jgi:predicted nucleotidyltransferase